MGGLSLPCLDGSLGLSAILQWDRQPRPRLAQDKYVAGVKRARNPFVQELTACRLLDSYSLDTHRVPAASQCDLS